jgi:hypothetical protein
VNDNIIRPIFGSKALIGADRDDFQFFRDNPARQYHVRPAAVGDLSLPDEPERQPNQDDIIVMEKQLDLDSDCGFSVQHWVYSVQGEVLDTDEDIGKLLEEMRRARRALKNPEAWELERPSVIYSSPGRSRQVVLTDTEIAGAA